MKAVAAAIIWLPIGSFSEAARWPLKATVGFHLNVAGAEHENGLGLRGSGRLRAASLLRCLL